MTLADQEVPITPSPHRWSVDDFMRADEAGIFQQRVELIEGELIDMPPQEDAHAWAVSRLVRIIVQLFPEPFWVKIQATVRLNEHSGPEPDVAVLSGPPSPPAVVAPVPLLLIEVSETTPNHDLGTKASLYAANNIADYWVVDLASRRLHVHRDPIPDASTRFGWRFNHIAVCTADQQISPLAKPNAMVEIKSFLA